jgi:hypothetical protein
LESLRLSISDDVAIERWARDLVNGASASRISADRALVTSIGQQASAAKRAFLTLYKRQLAAAGLTASLPASY